MKINSNMTLISYTLFRLFYPVCFNFLLSGLSKNQRLSVDVISSF